MGRCQEVTAGTLTEAELQTLSMSPQSSHPSQDATAITASFYRCKSLRFREVLRFAQGYLGTKRHS